MTIEEVLTVGARGLTPGPFDCTISPPWTQHRASHTTLHNTRGQGRNNILPLPHIKMTPSPPCTQLNSQLNWCSARRLDIWNTGQVHRNLFSLCKHRFSSEMTAWITRAVTKNAWPSLHCHVLHCTVLHYIAIHFPSTHCSKLHWNASRCTTLNDGIIPWCWVRCYRRQIWPIHCTMHTLHIVHCPINATNWTLHITDCALHCKLTCKVNSAHYTTELQVVLAMARNLSIGTESKIDTKCGKKCLKVPK